MNEFTPKKIDLSIINGGVEYTDDSAVQPNLFNDMVEGVAFVDEAMQAFTEQPDTSEANTIGEPDVTLVDSVVNGRKYKKLKFSHLKGESGQSALVYKGQVTDNTVPSVGATRVLYQPIFTRLPIVGDFTTFTLTVNETDIYNVVAEITTINTTKPPSSARDYCIATVRFISKLNGTDGGGVYYYQADEVDDWITAIPEAIPIGGLEQYGDTSYCQKLYEGQRNIAVGDIVIIRSPNGNSKGQHTVFAVLKQIISSDNCVLQIVGYLDSGLPSVTTADSGKFLRVSADGTWVAELIPYAEGVGF